MATLPQPMQQQLPDPQQAAPLTSQQQFGPNFEQLPEKLQKALWRIITELELEDDLARRRELRHILQRRLFFRGRQFDWWSETDGQYNSAGVTSSGLGLTSGSNDNDGEEQQPAFQHCTNVYQATCLTISAVLTQDPISARFWPASPSDPKDVQTAKNGTKVIDIIHRNNDWQNKLDEAAYFMCNDGFLGAYIRYVSDGEAYGYDAQDEMGSMEVPIGDPQVQCPDGDCGFTQPGTSETQPVCPQCGNPTTDIPPPTGNISYPTGATIETPKGQEVVTIVPALQLKRSMWADDQKEFLYLTWVRDVHKAKAKSTYPHIAQKLDSGPSTGDTGTTSESYEKIARRLLYQGAGYVDGGVNNNMGTFRSTWLRPSSFWKVSQGCTAQQGQQCDCDKCQLTKLYPHGAYVAFYGEVYCESRDECMDEKWETMHTLPGEGQNRETLMSASVPIQEQLNDCVNLIFEQAMYGVPEAFGNQNTIDFEARQKQGALPGNMTPIDLQPNQNITSQVLFSPAVSPSEALMQYKDELMGTILQYITGAYPALFGGDTGGNDTASGIATQRNQAMGRIGRAWKRLQIFCANVDGKSVRCFAKNRQNDMEIPKETNSGEWESDWVRIEDMQGNVIAYPEVDQGFPTLQSDVRGVMMSLLNEANPLFMTVAQSPENLEYVFRELGLSDLQVPGEAQRIKTYKDIDQLTQEQPQPGPPQPMPPPQPDQQSPAQGPPPPPPQSPHNETGAPDPQMQPGPMLPSVHPDPLIDDLPVVIATAKTWLISEAGLKMRDSTPAGYANVYLYLKAAEMMQKAQQLQQAIAQQSLAGQGPMADPGGAEAITAPQPPQPPVQDSGKEPTS